MKPHMTPNRPFTLGWIKMRASTGKLGASALLYLLSLGVPSAVAGEELSALLEKAQERLRTASGYHVEATITNDALSTSVTGDIAGDDFDLAIKLEDGVMQMRCARNKYWLSRDSGKTWRKTEPDRGLFDLIRRPGTAILDSNTSQLIPLTAGRQPKSGSQTIEVRPVPEPANLDVEHLPRYFIDTMPDGRPFLEQYTGPIIWLDRVLIMDVRYSKIDEISKMIAPEHVAVDPP